jgi:GNAT superfamily N-acetyltransferase
VTRPSFTIRPCTPADAATLVNLVRELAVYEELEAFASATPDSFVTHLFATRPVAEAILADVENEAVGYALYFPTFSSFRGQPGLYLEDLFVRPGHRGQGIGKALLAEVARRAVEIGCGRLEWAVLNWNTPSIGFYQSLGARPLDDWTTYRLDEDRFLQLARLALGNEPSPR